MEGIWYWPWGRSLPGLGAGSVCPVQGRSLANRQESLGLWLSAPRSKGEEEELKSRLQLLEPSCGPHPRSPACLSRTARMVLSAAQSRSRALQLGPSATSLAAERRASSRGQQGEDPAVSPTAAGEWEPVAAMWGLEWDPTSSFSAQLSWGCCSLGGPSAKPSRPFGWDQQLLFWHALL